jgi:NADH-quinone oxidoreductase subunit L
VGAALLAAALGTAFYMSRLYFLVFTGACRADEHTREHLHESPVEMVAPLVALALGALLAGVVGLPATLTEARGEWIGHWLAPAVGPGLEVGRAVEWRVMAMSTVLAGAGIGLAWLFFGGGVRAPARQFATAFPRLVAAVRGKFLVDEIYQMLVVRPLQGVARAFFLVVDRVLVDGLLVSSWAFLVDSAGRFLRLVQVGDMQRYLAIFATGLAALIYALAQPSAPSDFEIRIQGRSAFVELKDAEAKSGKLDFGFDFDGDGREDRSGSNPQASWSYSKPGQYKLRIRITDPRWDTTRTVQHTIDIR